MCRGQADGCGLMYGHTLPGKGCCHAGLALSRPGRAGLGLQIQQALREPERGSRAPTSPSQGIKCAPARRSGRVDWCKLWYGYAWAGQIGCVRDGYGSESSVKLLRRPLHEAVRCVWI